MDRKAMKEWKKCLKIYGERDWDSLLKDGELSRNSGELLKVH